MDAKQTKFKDSEISVLMKLVDKYKHIIENKKSDAVVWKNKQAAWEKITQEMNAANGTFRTSANIRGKYENLKKNTKKKFAQEKRNLYRTGGGVEPVVNITKTDEEIKNLLGVSLDGLFNEFDSDAVVIEITEDTENKDTPPGVEESENSLMDPPSQSHIKINLNSKTPKPSLQSNNRPLTESNLNTFNSQTSSSVEENDFKPSTSERPCQLNSKSATYLNSKYWDL